MKRLLMVAALTAAAVLAQLTTGPANGWLVIVGGGRIPAAIVERFVGLAGGPEAHCVLIPTAADDKELDLEKARERFVQQFGMRQVTVLHTRDRREADAEAFVAPLKQARAVWFGGGRQWRLVDCYLHTRTHRELEALLERGGVIGGTSAGASIQASYLVRGAREGNRIMMAKGYEEGLGFLRNGAVDQHLLRRKRQDDLVEVIAAHPELLGIGIDESTAVVAHGGQFEVVGESQVAIYDGREHGGRRYYFLSPGERFDLGRRRRSAAAASGP
jgi:cyanophycinase